MVELFILVVGLVLTAILALIHFAFAVVALTTFWIWFPTLLAVLLVFGIWLPDLS
jgi:hypothetical protein